jgi:hypothetical protein
MESIVVVWMPACEDMSPDTEECLLLEDITQQHSEDHDWGTLVDV